MQPGRDERRVAFEVSRPEAIRRLGPVVDDISTLAVGWRVVTLPESGAVGRFFQLWVERHEVDAMGELVWLSEPSEEVADAVVRLALVDTEDAFRRAIRESWDREKRTAVQSVARPQTEEDAREPTSAKPILSGDPGTDARTWAAWIRGGEPYSALAALLDTLAIHADGAKWLQELVPGEVLEAEPDERLRRIERGLWFIARAFCHEARNAVARDLCENAARTLVPGAQPDPTEGGSDGES